MAVRAVTIGKPRDEVFAFFRDFSNLARFMENIERIDVLDETPLALGGQGPGRAVRWLGTRC